MCSWLYRIRPAVVHGRFVPLDHKGLLSSFEKEIVDPNQMRWFPQPMPEGEAGIDFVDGLKTMAGSGDAAARNGLGIHVYTCNASMEDTAFQNSDGDFLIVPQAGTLHIQVRHVAEGRLFVHACAYLRRARHLVKPSCVPMDHCSHPVSLSPGAASLFSLPLSLFFCPAA